MLLSIMACGSIFSVDKSNSDTSDGKVYLDGARSLLDPWEDDYSVDHARVALLHSMFLFESNMKSAAWTCLGSAVRISQSLGLHTEPTSPHGLEAEMHRRVWWSIYVWDRYATKSFSFLCADHGSGFSPWSWVYRYRSTTMTAMLISPR